MRESNPHMMDMSHLFYRWTNSPKMKVFCSPSRLLIQTKLKISAQLFFSISGSSCSLLYLLYRLSFYLFRRVNEPQNPCFIEKSIKHQNCLVFEAIWKAKQTKLIIDTISNKPNGRCKNRTYTIKQLF